MSVPQSLQRSHHLNANQVSTSKDSNTFINYPSPIPNHEQNNTQNNYTIHNSNEVVHALPSDVIASGPNNTNTTNTNTNTTNTTNTNIIRDFGSYTPTDINMNNINNINNIPLGSAPSRSPYTLPHYTIPPLRHQHMTYVNPYVRDCRRIQQLNNTMARVRRAIAANIRNHTNDSDGSYLAACGDLYMRSQQLSEKILLLKRRFDTSHSRGLYENIIQRRRRYDRGGDYNNDNNNNNNNNNINNNWDFNEPIELLYSESDDDPELENNIKLINPSALQEDIILSDLEGTPQEYICPITQTIMADPVTTHDGCVYDRAAILKWFLLFLTKGRVPTSPLTNLELKDLTLVTNSQLHVKIREFLVLVSMKDGKGMDVHNEE